MSAIKNPSQIYSSLVTTALALGGWLGGCPWTCGFTIAS
jgi:hypothetical protein